MAPQSDVLELQAVRKRASADHATGHPHGDRQAVGPAEEGDPEERRGGERPRALQASAAAGSPGGRVRDAGEVLRREHGQQGGEPGGEQGQEVEGDSGHAREHGRSGAGEQVGCEGGRAAAS
eukprot:9131326-Alexandrium_andersonii.AAC.1